MRLTVVTTTDRSVYEVSSTTETLYCVILFLMPKHGRTKGSIIKLYYANLVSISEEG